MTIRANTIHCAVRTNQVKQVEIEKEIITFTWQFYAIV